MKKTLTLVLSLTLLLVISACGMFNRTVELPDLMFMDKAEIQTTLNDAGLEVYFINDETVERNQPNMFIRYQNRSVGDEVERGTVVTVIISSALEEEEEAEPAPRTPLDPDGTFTTYEDVALYLDTFNELPANFDQEDIFSFDPSDHEIVPDDAGPYDAVTVDDDHVVIFSDAGLIFSADADYTAFWQHFGNEDYPPFDHEGNRFVYGGRYTRTDDVALYARTFGKMPGNYYIRYERDTSFYRSLYGYLPELYDDFDIWQDLVELRRQKGEDAYYAYWHFSNHANQMSSRFEPYFIADTSIGGAGHSRGNERFVISPSNRLIYYTSDHFTTYTLLYGDARD